MEREAQTGNCALDTVASQLATQLRAAGLIGTTTTVSTCQFASVLWRAMGNTFDQLCKMVCSILTTAPSSEVEFDVVNVEGEVEETCSWAKWFQAMMRNGSWLDGPALQLLGWLFHTTVVVLAPGRLESERREGVYVLNRQLPLSFAA